MNNNIMNNTTINNTLSIDGIDKFDNESFDDYAFRHNLFKITYGDNNRDKSKIENIQIPSYPGLEESVYPTFLDYILNELWFLCNKYKLVSFDFQIKLNTQTIITLGEESKIDIPRQKWLLSQYYVWKTITATSFKLKEEQKEKERDRAKQKYLDLKECISETHKEQLDELLMLLIKTPQPPPNLDKEYKDFNDYWEKTQGERERNQLEKNENRRNKRIELYNKYMKNKEIKAQIIELEATINQLKSMVK